MTSTETNKIDLNHKFYKFEEMTDPLRDTVFTHMEAYHVHVYDSLCKFLLYVKNKFAYMISESVSHRKTQPPQYHRCLSTKYGIPKCHRVLLTYSTDGNLNTAFNKTSWNMHTRIIDHRHQCRATAIGKSIFQALLALLKKPLLTVVPTIVLVLTLLTAAAAADGKK